MHRLQILRLGLPLRHLRAGPQQLLRAQNPLRVDGREPGSGTGQGLLLRGTVLVAATFQRYHLRPR